jgi:hypothetical protein
MAIETPRYSVIHKDGAIEQRCYESYIIASVKLTAESYSSASNRAFAILADYIFGNNTAHDSFSTGAGATHVSEKIAMTAPVSASKKGRSRYEISFTMPSSYTLKSLPQPNSPAVHIQELAAHEVVVIRFSGLSTEKKTSDMTAKLRSWASDHTLKIVSEPLLSRFDPPWKPGLLRHNEISFRIL